MTPDVRRAIARINAGTGRGTGTLVAPDLLLTALHVVANRAVDPPEFYPGCVLTFPDHTSEVQVIDGLWDRSADWILLRVVTPPPGVRPVPLAEAPSDGEAWSTFGFPESNKRDGMALTGSVTNRLGTLDGTWAMQLFSVEAAAGSGAPVPGLSGGPVIIDGAIVGVMRFALMKDGLTVAGTVYACPVDLIAERAGDRLPLPDPTRGLPGLPVRPLPSKPFRFLERFRAEDAEVYFGRNRELRQLYDEVTIENGPPVVLLYGQSGTGKSSLLDAGLAPRLQSTHAVMYLRRDPARGLLATVLDAVGSVLPAATTARPSDATVNADALRLAWLGTETALGRPLVVILDQVDEVFTQRHEGGERGRVAGSTELAALADAVVALFQPAGVRGRLVIGFRKEYFAEIQKQFESRQVPCAKVFLQSLDSRAVRDVVNGPRRTPRLRAQYGLEIEDGLAEAIARDLTADRDATVSPTLQVLLSRMWEDATSESAHAPRFTHALYERLRSAGFLVSDFLDQQLRALAAAAAEAGGTKADVVTSGLALDVLAFYTTPLATTEPRDDDDLARGFAHRAADVAWLVQEFKRLYLLSDLAGDAVATRSSSRLSTQLAQVVRARLDRSQAPGQRARRVIENRAAEWGGDATGTPLDPADLALAERGLSGMRMLTPVEERLIVASRAARTQLARARTRRRMYAAMAVAVMAIAAAVVTYLTIQDQRQQIWRRLMALDAKVPALLDVHPLAALITAIQAVDGSLQYNGNSVLPSIKTNLARALDRARERQSWRVLHPVQSIAFSADGRIAAGTSDGIVQFFRLDGTAAIPEIQAAGRESAVLAVAFSDESGLIAAALGRPGVSLWTREGKPLESLKRQPDGAATVVTFVPGTDTLVAAYTSSDGAATTLCIWTDLSANPATFPVKTSQAISSLSALRRDAGDIIVALVGDDVRIVNGEGKVVVGPFATKEGSVTAADLTITPDRDVLLAYGSSDGSITVRKVIDAEPPVSSFPAGGPVVSLAFGREGRVVVAGTTDGMVVTFNMNGRDVAAPFVAASSTVGALAVSPDGESVAIAGTGLNDNYVRVIDTVTVEVHFPLSHDSTIIADEGTQVEALAFVSAGEGGHLLIAGGKNRKLDAWTLRVPEGSAWFEAKVAEIDAGQMDTRSIVADDSGRVIAVGTGGIQFRDVSGKLLDTKPLPAPGRSVAVTPDGQTAVVGDDEGHVTIWDVPARRLTHTIDAHKDQVSAVAITAAGDRIVSGSFDGALCFWTSDGTKIACAPVDAGSAFTAAVFDRDGTAFAGTSLGRVQRYDPKGRLMTSVIVFRDVLINALAIDRTETVFAASKLGVRWVDVESGALLDLMAHERMHGIRAVAVSRDGHLMAGAASDGNIYVWRVGWREWLTEACSRLRGHDAFVSVTNTSRPRPEACKLPGVDCTAAYRACATRVWSAQVQK